MRVIGECTYFLLYHLWKYISSFDLNFLFRGGDACSDKGYPVW